MKQELLVVMEQALKPKGGTLAREFKRIRTDNSMDWNREKSYALAIIAESDQLMKCDPDSVGRALLDLGILGLTLSPAMRLAYLIPYKRTCTVSPSYMGLEQIAYKTGFVELIETILVRKNDPEFNVWTDDKGRHIKHTEATEDRGEVTHAYCRAWFSSGRQHIEVMDKTEILACRDAAYKKNGNKMPFTWKGDFRGEMYKKCVMRRGWKHWPRIDNPAVVAMMTAVDRADPLEFGNDENVINHTTKIDQTQIDELVKTMVEAGIDERGHDSWLHGLAKKLGYRNIRALESGDFDAAASMMEEGVKVWTDRKKSNAAQSSDSEQVDTTAQTAAT